MKRIIPLFIIALVLICPILAEEAHATTVFLTSDNVLGHDEDMQMLNDIKQQIETKSNGQITVIVDENASNPGEGTRAMNADCDIAVTIAYACAGNLVDLGSYSVQSTKKIIYVNAGSLDLTSINFLRRSYDDNWSSSSFASLQNPGQYLYDSGITLLQPGQKFYGETDNGNLDHCSSEIDGYIADEVMKQVYSNGVIRKLDSDYINRHKLDPKYLAEDSKKIVDGFGTPMADSYGSYTTQQLLYMSASYLVGYSLDVPQQFAPPENPAEYSAFTKGTYSFNEYCEMADIVVDYMNEHGKAPDSISYKGATISYYDLVYNFALLTQDDFDAAHMNFPQNADFQKYNSNILLDILPIAIIIVVIIAVAIIIRKLIKKGRRGIKRIKNRGKDNNYYRNQASGNRSRKSRGGSRDNYSRNSARYNNSRGNQSSRKSRNSGRPRNSRNSRDSRNSKNKRSTKLFHKNVDLDQYDNSRSKEPKRLNKKR